MGFQNYHNRTNSPAKVYSKWRGGEGKLTHWDGQATNDQGGQGAEVEEKLPFKFAILEQTRRIQGFAPGKGTSTRYYSNEAVEYDDVLKVMAKDGDNPAREVCTGKYADIKDKLPQGARLAVQLYVYVPERDQIECVTCQGASLGAFIEFSKKNKIYENYVTIEKDPEQKKNGAVTFYAPLFKLGEGYDKDTMAKLVAKDSEVTNYLKQLHESNDTSVPLDAIDQTPRQYDGEQSQEIVEDEDKAEDENPVDFNAIPF